MNEIMAIEDPEYLNEKYFHAFVYIIILEFKQLFYNNSDRLANRCALFILKFDRKTT